MDGSAKIYTCNFGDVLAQEHRRIRIMRGEPADAAQVQSRPEDDNPPPGQTGAQPGMETTASEACFAGLAISGGGIRSASFATGMLQGLVAGDLLEKIDYLSTVSGGGYIGSSLTWFLSRGIPNPQGPGTVPAGTTAANFPYGSGDIGGRAGARQPALDFIRDHGKYLTPDSGLNLTSALSVVARSMFTSLLAYLLLVWLVMVPLHWGHLFDGFSLSRLPYVGSHFVGLTWSMNLLWWSAIALLIVMSVLSVLLSLRTAAPALYPDVQYAGLNRAQKIGGVLITITLTLLVIGSLPYVQRLIDSLWFKVTAAGLSTISTILGTLLSAYELSRKNTSGSLGTVRIVLGAALLIYGLLLGGYLLSGHVGDWKQLVVLGIAVLAIGGVVNINHVGIHRMYRDRLMETFMPDTDTLRAGRWDLAKAADKALLETFCGETVARPYHLINTNIVLTDSLRPKYRGRAGHSFLLSPLYCGSDATGWRLTAQYMKGGWALLGSRGMTLATAMAISGAAANPNAGVAGRGLTRNPIISALMTLLNLRLGYWATHPGNKSAGPFPPNFLIPGLRAGIFGRGLRETANNIELTDGGHFENLGLYELLRRRVRVIIVSDAAADPHYEFGDLANALERARVDFGIEINFRPSRTLAEVVPGPHTFTGEKQRMPYAVRAFAVGDIYYNNGPGIEPGRGLLLYLKSTLIDGLSEDICGYYVSNPEFPNQPTTDQFFDEAQFEAYRELGYQLCLQMVKEIQAEQWL
jgi:hypothetical protein